MIWQLKKFDKILSVLLVWTWSIFGWFINYLYHPVMLKFLTIQQFAEFESLVSMFNVLWVFTTGFGLFIVNEVLKYNTDLGRVKAIFYFWNILLFGLWVFLYIIFVLCSNVLADYLKFDSTYPILFVWISIIFTFLYTVPESTLRWLKKFSFVSFMFLLWPILKLAWWVLFVYFGMALYWAIWWFIFSLIFTFLVGFIYLIYVFKWHDWSIDMSSVIIDFKKSWIRIVNFLVIALLLSFFINIDIILAKNIFDVSFVWVYAWLSVVAKILVFCMLAVEVVYYSYILDSKWVDLRKNLIHSYIIISMMWVLSLIVSYFIWAYILDMMKEWLGEYLHLFMLLLVYNWIFWYLNLYSKLMLWWWKGAINILLFIGLILIVVCVYSLDLWNIEKFIYSFISVAFLLKLIIIWRLVLSVRVQ